MLPRFVALLFCLLVSSSAPVAAQPLEAPKEYKAQGQVKVGIHIVKLNAGQLYSIHVDGSFHPFVSVAEDPLLHFSGDKKAVGIFTPKFTQECRFTVSPTGHDVEEGLLDYTFVVRPLERAKESVFSAKEVIAEKGPKIGGVADYVKVFRTRFNVGQQYLVELKTDKETRAQLQVQDAAGRIVAMAFSQRNQAVQAILGPAQEGEYSISVRVLSDIPREVELAVYPINPVNRKLD